MNLALQTRRAVITLSLMALAVACLAAKTVSRHDALSAEALVRIESVVAKTVRAPAAVRVAQPVVTARCEAKITSI